MTIDIDAARQVLAAARDRVRAHPSTPAVLLETEGLGLLGALGIPAPRWMLVSGAEEAADTDTSGLGAGRVVVKVISPRILHKSDVGGVKVVSHTRNAIVAAIADMERRLGGQDVAGFTINEFVGFEPAPGNELLVGLRATADFGPVVTLGFGGIYTEFLAAHLEKGREIAVFSPAATRDADILEAIGRLAVGRLATTSLRGQPPRIDAAAVVEVIARFMALARAFAPDEIAECEINPLVITPRGLVALDILVKLGSGPVAVRPPRPLHKLRHLLEPESAAIIGVSEKLNPGHIILNNLIREGFDRSRISVVKPGSEQLEGCRVVPDIASLPGKVDLFILAVSAAQTPQVVTEIVRGQKAESLIVIPGGLEEKAGTEAIVHQMREALSSARASDWQGPLINGGNCLGVRSIPGRYDTMFIPEYKLPVPSGAVSPIAFVSQSGAFAVARMSTLGALNPRYAITLGNQMDLTVGDYLTYLKDDPALEVFAVYVEGFQPLDGLAFLSAAREITESGRTVILYRAGRTAAGARASASHTASIAGDYTVTRELARAAGVVLAGSLADFEDLVRLFTFLRGKRAGTRLGALTNAGFEAVAIADNLGALELAPFDAATTARLQGIFTQARIDSVVDVHNPIDLTPMAGDQAYDDSMRAMLDSDAIDLAIVGIVPLTGALNSLPAGPGHREDLSREDSIASRLGRLQRESTKAWVAVVDAGRLYDPLADALLRERIPTFRTADRALRLLNLFVARLARSGVK
ncbi:MAG TPA: acetate--CoA ligase family protein [Vicinamibacterales bacterium]|nr:acetate--CoA ligase family protein [Vicinamibacterales bacterium]